MVSDPNTALIVLTNFIYKNLNDRKHVTTIFIDLKKAFDTVNHEILLNKLQKIGIRGIAYQWIKSYISHRTQYTKIDHTNSDTEELTVGLPQGSKLSPILYLIYVNDINKFSQSNSINLNLFADDTSLTICNNNKSDLENNANLQLNLLNKWFQANKLTINKEKTNYLYYRNTENLNLNIENNHLEQRDSIKYLGLILDKDLNFKEHIDYIIKKIRKKMPIIVRLKYKLDTLSKLKIYYAFVYSNIQYGCEIYGKSTHTHLNKLQSLQNKIIGFLFKKPNTKTNTYYRKYKILKIKNIIKLNIIKTLYLYKQQKLPTKLTNEINSYVERNLNYNLRNNDKFPIYRYKNKIGSKHFYNNVKIWNALSPTLKGINNEKLFLKKYKNELNN